MFVVGELWNKVTADKVRMAKESSLELNEFCRWCPRTNCQDQGVAMAGPGKLI